MRFFTSFDSISETLNTPDLFSKAIFANIAAKGCSVSLPLYGAVTAIYIS
jgi:hypothetical protein